MLHCNKNTVSEVRKRLVEKGFAAALERKKRSTPPKPRLFDGEAEARLSARKLQHTAVRPPPLDIAIISGPRCRVEHRAALHR